MSNRKEKAENELLKEHVTKAKIATIRLKHSLNADREINEVIPQLQEQFDRATRMGVQASFATLSYMGAKDALGIAEKMGKLELPLGVDDEV